MQGEREMYTRRHTATHLQSETGGSASAELFENPSNKLDRRKAWEALLSKGLSESKLESNIKLLDTGYIATVFSTNYSTCLARRRRRPHHTKSFDRDDLLLSHALPACSGRASSRHRTLSMVSDTTLVRPLLSLNKEEASTGQRAVPGRVEGAEYLESMGSGELLKDLDEHGDFAKAERSLSLSNMDFPCLKAAVLMDPLNQSNESTGPHTVSVLRRARTLPRAKYLTSFDSTENVDTLIVTSESLASGPEQSVCVARLDTYKAEELMEPTLIFHDGEAPESDGVNKCRSACDTSNVEPFPLCETSLHVEDHPREQVTSTRPHSLQKALSMKYILNDCSIESEEPQILPVYHASPQLSMLHASVHNNDDDDEDHQASISCASSCMSSPEFSSAASLKDWLLSEDSSFMPAACALQAGNETSIFDAFEFSDVLLGPDLPKTKSLLLKYVGGGYSPDDTDQSIFQAVALAD